MAIFKNQIEDLAGTIPATADAEQFLNEGVVDVVHRIKALYPEHLPLFAKEQAIVDGGTTLHDTDVLEVERASKVCRAIPSSGRHAAVDTTSISYAPASDPVYYFLNEKIYVKPTGGSPTCSVVQHGAVVTWDSEPSGINSFPEDNYFQVIMYAAMQVLHHKMVESIMPTDITLETIPSLSLSATVPTAPTLTNLTYIAPSLGTINTVSYSGPSTALDVSAITNANAGAILGISNPPVYNSGAVIGFGDSTLFWNLAALTVNDLSISVAPPVPPTVPDFTTPSPAIASATGSFTKTLSGNAPIYTSPTALSISSFDTFSSTFANLSVTAVAPEAPSAPNFTERSFTIPSPSLQDSTGTIPVTDMVNAITSISKTLSGTAPAYNSGAIVDIDTSTITLPVSPVSPSIVSFTSFSGISDLSITSVPPEAPANPDFTTPDVSTITVGSLGTAPVYTPPTIGGGADDLSDMTDSDWTTLDFDFDGENIDFATWFQAAGAMIQNQEDIELASMQLQKIAAYVNSYSMSMQNRLNAFNDTNVEYQATIQEAITNAQIAAQKAQTDSNLLLQQENQEYGAELSKYQAELGQYQQEVNAQVTEYTQNLGKAMQSWSTEQQNALGLYGANLQRYQAELGEYGQKVQRLMGEHAQKMQDHMNLFSDANTEYQATIQRDMAELQAQVQSDIAEVQTQTQADVAKMNKSTDVNIQLNAQILQKESQEWQQLLQKESNEYTAEVSKYQAELQQYQQEVGAQVQEYTQNIGKLIQTWSGEQQNELARYGAELQNNLNVFNMGNAEYQASVQRDMAELQAQVQADISKMNKSTDVDIQAKAQVLQEESSEFTGALSIYQAQLQQYQQDVGKEVQQYQANSQKDITIFQAEQQMALQQHGQLMQDAMNLFNDDNAEYQSTLQEAIQRAQLENSANLANMQKDLQIAIGNEDRNQQRKLTNAVQYMQATIADNGNVLAKYQAEIQNASQAMSDDAANNQNDLAKYQAEIGAYQQELSAEMGEYGQNMQRVAEKNSSTIQDFGARVQKASGEYQWLQGQLAMVAQQYNQSFMAAQPQPQGVQQ